MEEDILSRINFYELHQSGTARLYTNLVVGELCVCGLGVDFGRQSTLLGRRFHLRERRDVCEAERGKALDFLVSGKAAADENLNF